jgi:hypothetical protein
VRLAGIESYGVGKVTGLAAYAVVKQSCGDRLAQIREASDDDECSYYLSDVVGFEITGAFERLGAPGSALAAAEHRGEGARGEDRARALGRGVLGLRDGREAPTVNRDDCESNANGEQAARGR